MNELINVRLEGGPTALPVDHRVLQVATTDSKIKVQHDGGYEHFELTDESHPEDHVVYRWTSRTRIAE
jgi:hypothetical protein